MNKLGWAIFTIICVCAIAFFSVLRIGGPGVADKRPGANDDALVRNDLNGMPLLHVPVAGVPRSAIEDNWGDPRDEGMRAHHGIDIMAPGGTLVTAAAPGMINKIFTSKAGGLTLYIRSPHRGWMYYYAHLAGYAPGVREGLAVKAGDPLGYVGDTGNAGAGNYHLHFSMSKMRSGERWWQGTPTNPFPLLAAKGGGG